VDKDTLNVKISDYGEQLPMLQNFGQPQVTALQANNQNIS
jgi:hypothetical protein